MQRQSPWMQKQGSPIGPSQEMMGGMQQQGQMNISPEMLEMFKRFFGSGQIQTMGNQMGGPTGNNRGMQQSSMFGRQY